MAKVRAKPASDNGKPNKTSAAALMASAKRAPGPVRSSPFDCPLPLEDMAAKILNLTRQRDELERELRLKKDQIRVEVDPWYKEQVKRHGHESSVRVPGDGAGTLRITYQDRYLKLDLERLQHIREALGSKTDTYFSEGATLSVRKEITEDPQKLSALVEKLAELLGPEGFAETFVAEQVCYPTTAFTQRRYNDLSSEQNAKLELIGVKQVVAFAEHKGK
jgi:hypothetical protein